MTDQIGIAILGCGYWGINYVRVFHELSQARVIAVCDSRTERLQEVGQRFPEVVLTTQIEDVLEMGDVDAVVVCTEATSHYDVARRCLVARKHVLVEKPLATTEADAKKLITLTEATGITLMVSHTFLYNAGIRKMKEYITGNNMGQVYYLYSRRTNMGPVRRDVNALWDLATHDVSIFNYLLNDTPVWVSAVGCRVLRNGREDVGFISVGYEDDIIGHIHVSWADPNKVRELVVVGSDMRIVFDDLNTLEQVRIFEKGISSMSVEALNFGEFHFQMRDGDIISPKIEASEPLKNQCSHFLTCVADERRPLTDGLDGLAVVRVLTAIDLSIKRRGAPIEIAPENLL